MSWYGCCCNNACRIAKDDFDRADEDPVTGWTEVVGTDWEVVSNSLRTSTDNAVLKFDTPHPRAISSAYVTVWLYGADGDQLRVLVNYTDSNNYHFAQFTIGSNGTSAGGCIELYERSGGSNTLLSKRDAHLPAATLNGVSVYFGDGLFSIGSAGSSGSLWAPATGSGTYVGLGTGTIAGEVRFGSFVFNLHHSTFEGEEGTPPDPDERPCPQNPPGCSWFTGTSGMGNGSDVGCNWTVAAGSWTVSSGNLVTASSSARLSLNAKHPIGGAGCLIRCAFNFGNSADRPRITFDDDGAGSFAYVEFTTSTFTVKSPGGATLSTGSWIGDVDGNAVVCWADGIVTVLGSANVGVLAMPAAGNPRTVGVGTGSVTTGVTFTAFQVEQSRDNVVLTCNTCRSECCCGKSPTRWVVDFGAPWLTNNACAACDDLTGEFELEFGAVNSAGTVSYPNNCSYHYYSKPWCDDDFVTCQGAGTPNWGEAIFLEINLFLGGPCGGGPNCGDAGCTVNVQYTLGKSGGASPPCVRACGQGWQSSIDPDGTSAECIDSYAWPAAITKYLDFGCPNGVGGGAPSAICVDTGAPTTVDVRPAQ